MQTTDKAVPWDPEARERCRRGKHKGCSVVGRASGTWSSFFGFFFFLFVFYVFPWLLAYFSAFLSFHLPSGSLFGVPQRLRLSCHKGRFRGANHKERKKKLGRFSLVWMREMWLDEVGRCRSIARWWRQPYLCPCAISSLLVDVRILKGGFPFLAPLPFYHPAIILRTYTQTESCSGFLPFFLLFSF